MIKASAYSYLLKPSANTVSFCYKERKPCVWWVDKYFKDCLCNLRDDFSFSFGFISLIAWGVAEVPQIITNFHSKSSHGVSLLFLLTWVAGDIFNLVGCLLEPATLPTQYYTAVLYTTSTIVLVLQGLYYDYFRRWCRQRRGNSTHQQDTDEKTPLDPEPPVKGIPIPIPNTMPQRTPARKEFYYTSARSLAGSGTPPFRSSYLRAGARSGPSALAIHDHSSSDNDDEDTTTPNILRSSDKAVTRPIPIPRSAAQATAIATAISLPIQGKGMAEAYMGFTGRRLLQVRNVEHSAFGQWLGWLMAAIYMGGRFPQIILNAKRGSVDGLNPLMFIFALVANVTYVLSILVRSTEWDKIKANLPWLLDAAVCVVLDLFIILQYVYYRYMRHKDFSDDDGDYYVEADHK